MINRSEKIPPRLLIRIKCGLSSHLFEYEQKQSIVRRCQHVLALAQLGKRYATLSPAAKFGWKAAQLRRKWNEIDGHVCDDVIASDGLDTDTLR